MAQARERTYGSVCLSERAGSNGRYADITELYTCPCAQGARHVAKDLAGQQVANPTATLLATSMLLRHVSLHKFADRYAADCSTFQPDLCLATLMPPYLGAPPTPPPGAAMPHT